MMPINPDDWTQSPITDTPDNIWEAFHDATLEAISSNRLRREVSVTLRLGFPEPPEPCPERIVITLKGVSHALVYTYWNWPGPWPSPPPNPTPEMQTAVAQYYQNSRTETSDLGIFRRWIEDEIDLDVSNADLHRTTAGLTLVLHGTTNDPESASAWQLRIGAEDMDIVEPNGTLLGLESLLRLGRSGWEAWSARSIRPIDAES